MITFETGLFPLTGILVCGALYAVYRSLLRLKSSSRWTQMFIATAVVLTTMVSMVTLVREVEGEILWGSEGAGARGNEFLRGNEYLRGSEGTGERGSEPSQAVSHTTAPTSPSTTALQPAKRQSRITPLKPVHIYLLGVICVMGYFIFQLVWLLRLRKHYPCTHLDDADIYIGVKQPFSFGRSIFLPSAIDDEMRHYILLHEQAHIRHRHFLKLCGMQMLIALNWYNPFVWLFFSEMRLQQELEVDSDVLAEGVDRQAYQLSLLRICTQQGKWILLRSAFGIKPLKQRIVFMNQTLNPSAMHRCQTLAATALMLTVTAAAAFGCQTREKQTAEPVREHPMKGCWTMDWISNTGSGEEVHPVAMHYGFYNDSTFLCFSYWRKKGRNLNFSMSGEGYAWRGDTLVDAQGHPTDYTFPDERTAISRWLKDSTQMAGVKGPDITEQWSRIKPNEDIVDVLRAVSAAKNDPAEPRMGVWQEEKNKNQYLILTDSVFMVLRMHPSTVTRGFRYGASGSCGTVSRGQSENIFLLAGQPFEINLTEAGHQTLTVTGDKFKETYHRIDMPAYLLRAFSPALPETEETKK